MFELLRRLPDWVALILVCAVIWWGVTFNKRLEERYHCTACTFRGIAGGAVGIFCWMLSSGAVGGGMERLIAGTVALVITLALFLSNRAKSGSVRQGILMTVWQLFVGLVVFAIYCALDTRNRKKK